MLRLTLGHVTTGEFIAHHSLSGVYGNLEPMALRWGRCPAATGVRTAVGLACRSGRRYVSARLAPVKKKSAPAKPKA